MPGDSDGETSFSGTGSPGGRFPCSSEHAEVPLERRFLMIEWLWLLLPLAAVSGWWTARRSNARHSASGSTSNPSFLRGLNYLLDEQPDKAIDVFVKLAEIDGETAETHLALGSLFRRRGEVDRAIRIHQNLVSRPNLSKEQRGYALVELGQDYMRAGLFDRAESVFGELVEMKLHRRRALEGLREIYQQEKDWPRCLEVAEQLRVLTGEPVHTESAHYHCELAEEALKRGDRQEAASRLSRAQATDSHCVRATMLQAGMAMYDGAPQAAAELYERVAHQESKFLPEILPELLDAYRHSGHKEALAELERLYRERPSSALALALSDALREAEGDEAAIDFLVEYVSRLADPAGLERLLEIYAPKLSDQPQSRAINHAALGVVGHLRLLQPAYQCENCGFAARRLHWQCPSCKRWGSIKLVEPEAIGKAPACGPTAASPD